jgi:hypothetical protein
MSLSLTDALTQTGGDLTQAMDLILESLNNSISSTQESLDSLTLLQQAVDNGDQDTVNSLTESIISSNENVLQNSSNILEATSTIVQSAETYGGDTTILNEVLISTQSTFDAASLALENYTSSILQNAIDAINDENLTKEEIMNIHKTAVTATKASNSTVYTRYLNTLNLIKAQEAQNRITREEYMSQFRVFTIPITLDAQADTTIFGEQLSVSYDYYFSDVSALYLSADHFNNAFKYRDQNNGSALFNIDQASIVLLSVAMEFELALNTFELDSTRGPSVYADASNSPTPDSFGNHYVQYLASLLFSHPQAQAPIKNDDYIKYQIEVLSGIANQIYTQFSNDVSNSTAISQGIVKSMYEQLILDKHRIPPYDSVNDTDYKMFDFKPGDLIEFTVNASSNVIYEIEKYPGVVQSVNPDETFHYLNSDNYDSGGLVKSKTWRFGFRLK